MTEKGLSIIFISHKLHEVMAASDRVAVLRGGRMVAERKTAQTNPAELAELMVGRKVERPVRHDHDIGAPVLVAEQACDDLEEEDAAERCVLHRPCRRDPWHRRRFRQWAGQRLVRFCRGCASHRAR